MRRTRLERAINGAGFGGGGGGGGALPPGVPPTVATLQTGHEARAFASGAYFSCTGTGFSFAANTSLYVLFRLDSIPTATATLFQYALASTNGWRIQLDTSGQVLLAFPGGGSTVATGYTATVGYNAFCVAKDTAGTNTLRASIRNLLGPNPFAIPTMVSPTGSSVCRIGNDDAGATPLTTGSVLAVQAYGQTLTDVEIVTKTAMGQDNRWLPVPSATHEGSLVVDWEVGAARDWNGVATTSTSGGSAPITFAVVGAVTLGAVTPEDFFAKSPIDPYVQDDSYPGGNPGGAAARYAFLVDSATEMYVDTITQNFGGVPDTPDQLGSGVWDSVDSAANTATFAGFAMGGWTAGVRACVRVPLPGTGKRVVEVWNGPQARIGGTTFGNVIVAIRFPHGVVQPVAAVASPPNRVVVIGDSITVGFLAQPTQEFGYGAVYRNAHRSTVGIMFDAWGNAALSDNCTNVFANVAAYAAHLAPLLDDVQTGGRKVLVVALSVNDYLRPWQSAANFQTQLTALITAVRGLVTGLEVFVHGMTILASEVANSFGDNPDAYRTAAANAVASFSSSAVTYTNFKTVVSVGQLVDGVHPNIPGHAAMAAAQTTELGF